MKLETISLMPENPQRAVEFFTKICGLSIVKKIKNENIDIKFLAQSIGETSIEIVDTGENKEADLSGLSLIFKKDRDFEDLRKDIKDLGYKASDIIDMPPKPKFIKAQGPCGICIEFI